MLWSKVESYILSVGWQINHLDLAPKLAGILVAVSQCFSNLAGIFSPLAAGAFIEESVSSHTR